MARSKEAQEAHEKLVQAMREYNEWLENLPPEERAKEEAHQKAVGEWLYPETRKAAPTDLPKSE